MGQIDHLMETLKSDLRFDSVELQLPCRPLRWCWLRRGVFFFFFCVCEGGDEGGAFKQISWKRLNASSIT